MPKCDNCGAHITEQYVRVFAPEGADGVGVCPWCPDLVRDGAGARPARSNRGRLGTGPAERTETGRFKRKEATD